MLRATRSMVMVFAVGALFVLPLCAHAATGDIVARLGPGGSPQWSPDGQLLAFVYKGGLYVAPADGKGTRAKLPDFSGQNYIWASDSDIVYLEKPQRYSDTSLFKSVVFQRDVSPSGKCLGIKGIAAPALLTLAAEDELNRERVFGPVRLIDGAVGYFAAKGSLDNPARFVPFPGRKQLTARESRWPRVLVLREGHRFSPGWGYLCLASISGWDAPGRPLTTDESFGFPVLSPQGDKVIALSLGRQSWVIMDTSGHEITSKFETQGKDPGTGYFAGAVGMTWAPDGNRLCYMRSLEDSERIIDMRLMVSDLANKNVVELVGPDCGDVHSFAWSPQGTAIAVSTSQCGIIIVRVPS